MEISEKDLELLVKIAAREQRYACIERMNAFDTVVATQGDIQNTACPDIAATIAKWRKELSK